MNVVELMKALGHETRLRILHLLLTRDALCVCDLFEVLQLPQPTVSRHLKLLRDAGLVSDYRENQWVHYEVNKELKEERRRVMDVVLAEAKHEKLLKSDLLRLDKAALAVCC